VENKEEAELKKRILSNPDDPDIMKDIMRIYRERIYWCIRRIVLVHEDASDVFQETMIKIWKNLGKYKGESTLFTWIYRIATNEALQHLRKKDIQTFENPDGALSVKDMLNNDPYFHGNRIQLALQEAIARLPEKQRLVFQYRYFDELSYEQISEITGTSQGALKASFHHAMEKIENELKKAAHDIFIQ
jgi:RNA polymerase sigma-70 factor (ECF subfamily)